MLKNSITGDGKSGSSASTDTPGLISVSSAILPFRSERVDTCIEAGKTVYEIFTELGIHLTELTDARVFVDDRLVDPAEWRLLRPRAGQKLVINVIPSGGSSDGKNPAAMLLSIGVMLISGPLAGAIGNGLGVGSSALAMAGIKGAVMFAGMAAVRALAPPYEPYEPDRVTKYSIEGARNSVDPFGAVPVLLGQMRIVPPMLARPYTVVEGDDVYLHSAFNLGYGPMQIDMESLKIGETALSDYEGVSPLSTGEYTGDPSLIYETETGQRLSWFGYDTYDEALNIQVERSADWITRTTQPDTDTIDLTLMFPSGLNYTSYKGKDYGISVDFEVQYAPAGTSDWRNRSGTSIAGRSFNYSEIRALGLQNPIYSYGVIDPAFVPPFAWVVVDVEVGEMRLSIDSGLLQWDNRPQNLRVLGRVMALDDGSIQYKAETENRPAGFAMLGIFMGVDEDYISFDGGANPADLRLHISDSTNNVRYLRRRFQVPRGQYDVRIRRLTDDHKGDSRYRTTSVWTSLKSINHASAKRPVQMAGLTVMSFRIRASEQLNGIVDEFNCVATSVVPDYDHTTGTWVTRATNNPASLYRYILQGAPNKRRVPDSRIDLAGLERWHDFCRINGYTCNHYLRSRATVRDMLHLVAATGRASPNMLDGRYGVVIEEAKSVPVQHFSPRNSWGFKGSKSFATPPHALRVTFQDAAQGYRQNEVLVYDEGYTGANATVIEGLDLPGKTNAEEVTKFATYYLAALRLRPEVYTWQADVEHLVCTRGDLVRVSHDVPLWGIRSGRIADITVVNGQITEARLDARFTLDSVETNGVRIRCADNSELAAELVYSAGESDRLVFATPLPEGSFAVDDLAMVGVQGRETTDLIIKSIEPGADLTATITAVDLAPALFTIDDTVSLPPHDPNITLPTRIAPPTIESVSLTRSSGQPEADGSYSCRMAVKMRPAANFDVERIAGVEVQYRALGKPMRELAPDEWVTLPMFAPTARTAYVDGVYENIVYEVRARYVLKSGPATAWPAPVTVLRTSEGSTNTPPPRPPAAPDVTGLRLKGEANSTTFSGPDIHIEWNAVSTSGVIELGQETEEQGLGVGGVDRYFQDYFVQVIDPASSKVLAEVPVQHPEFTYTYTANAANAVQAFGEGAQPLRRVGFRVVYRGIQGQVSESPAYLEVENPAPALPTGVSIEEGIVSARVKATMPADLDLSRFNVYLGTATGFTPSPLNRVASVAVEPGVQASVDLEGLQPDTVYYIRWETLDKFAQTGQLSSELAFTTGKLVVGNVDGLQGELDIINQDVADAEQRIGTAEGRLDGHDTDIAGHATTLNQHATTLSQHKTTLDGHATDLGNHATQLSTHATDIAANTSAINTLKTTVNDPETGVSANASAVQGLDTRVTSAEGTITSIGSRVDSLETTVNHAETGVAANASAVDALDTRVTSAEGTISSHSTSITSLQGRVTNTESGVSGNTSAIDGLETRVTSNEGTISSHSSRLTGLESRVTTAEGEIEGNAGAISGLDTRVTAAEGNISAVSTEVTKLEAKVVRNPAWRRGFEPDDVWATTTGDTLTRIEDATGPYGELTSTETAPSTSGQTAGIYAHIPEEVAIPFGGRRVRVTVVAKVPASGGVAEFAVAYSNDVGNSGWNRFTPTTTWQAYSFTYDVPAPSSGGTDVVGIWADTAGTGTNKLHVRSVTVEPLTSEGELPQIGANATAISGLDSRVTSAEGTISTHSSSITALDNRLNAAEGSISGNSSAISGLDSRVTSAEGTISSQGSAITSLENRVTTAEGNVSGNTSAISGLDSRVTAAEGSISSQSTQLTQLESDVSDLQTDTSGNASAIQGLDTRVTSAEGTISSHSSSLTQLNTTVGEHTTSISQQASSINGIEAKYAVKIDANGAIAGFGLISTANDDLTDPNFSEFFVNADRFAVLPQGGDPATDAVAPFVVENNAVWIDEAFIRRLEADKIDAGTLKVQMRIESQGSIDVVNGSYTTKLGVHQVGGANYALRTSDGVTSPFAVTSDGVLKATGAEISGKITIAANSTGIANLSDAGALATKDKATWGTDIADQPPLMQSSLVLPREELFSFTQNLSGSKGTGVEAGYVVSRREDGLFGSCIAIEEATTNLIPQEHLSSFHGFNGVDPAWYATEQSDGFWRLVRKSPQGTDATEMLMSHEYPITEGQTYTESFLFRHDGVADFMVSFYTNNGHHSVTPSIEDLGGGLKRASASYTTVTGDVDIRAVDLRVNSPSTFTWFEIRDAQLEQKSFATSFVNGSRPHGKLVLPGVSESINWSKFGMLAWVRPHVLGIGSQMIFGMWPRCYFGITPGKSLQFGAYSDSTVRQASFSGLPLSESWHLIGFDYDAVAGKVRVFLDAQNEEQVFSYPLNGGVTPFVLGQQEYRSTEHALNSRLQDFLLLRDGNFDPQRVKEIYQLRQPLTDPNRVVSAPTVKSVSAVLL